MTHDGGAAGAELDLKWAAASEFIRDVVFALGKPEPAPEAIIDLPALALEVVGQIEELKVDNARLRSALRAPQSPPHSAKSGNTVDVQLACASGRHDYWHPQNQGARCRWCDKPEIAPMTGSLRAPQQQEGPELPEDGVDWARLLELDGPVVVQQRVAAFLRLYARRIRKGERWDIPKTMAAAYESAANALESVAALRAPQEAKP